MVRFGRVQEPGSVRTGRRRGMRRARSGFRERASERLSDATNRTRISRRATSPTPRSDRSSRWRGRSRIPR
uniref:Uncharacterized protein n=1 Tax=uncultured marine virus TaxID=186617 RepID=A0A0F7L8U5_9VIRU|nr:hypothetical protein [uncultured marine virus]